MELSDTSDVIVTIRFTKQAESAWWREHENWTPKMEQEIIHALNPMWALEEVSVVSVLFPEDIKQ